MIAQSIPYKFLIQPVYLLPSAPREVSLFFPSQSTSPSDSLTMLLSTPVLVVLLVLLCLAYLYYRLVGRGSYLYS